MTYARQRSSFSGGSNVGGDDRGDLFTAVSRVGGVAVDLRVHSGVGQ